jgi:hypothetical protein
MMVRLLSSPTAVVLAPAPRISDLEALKDAGATMIAVVPEPSTATPVDETA